MNIFVLDEDPIKAANLLDKHIVKMPLETAQILCTVARSRGFEAPYKSTHVKHPAVLWTAQSSANWSWLCEHGLALCHEYTKRYKKRHKCQDIIIEMQLNTEKIWGEDLHYSKHTAFVQCMPDEYKRPNAVDAYRAYYIGAKKDIAKWDHSEKPSWF